LVGVILTFWVGDRLAKINLPTFGWGFLQDFYRFGAAVMLTYLLALVVGLSSFALYMSAFFYPDLYRKGDLAWSGVGLFYALVLWFSAERITGGVLLGQMASVSLIGWLGWQALNARLGSTAVPPLNAADLKTGLEKVISPEQREKLTAQANQQFSKVKEWGQALLSTTAKPPEPPATTDTYTPLTPEDFGQPPVTIETPASPEEAEPIAIADTDITAPPEIEPTSVPETLREVPTTTETLPTVPKAVRDQPNPMAMVTGLFKSVTGLFNPPKKNTSTYVRKEFRDGEVVSETIAEPVAEGVEATAATLDEPPSASVEIAESVSAAVTEQATLLGGFGDKLKDSLGKVAKKQVEALDKSVDRLQDSVTDAVKEPLETLKETAAEVKDAVTDAAADLKTTVTDQAQEIKQVAQEAAEEQIDHLQDAAKDVQDAMKSKTEASADALQAATDDLKTAVTKTAEEQTAAIDQTVTEWNEAIADAASKSGEALVTQFQDAVEAPLDNLKTSTHNVVDDLLDTLDDRPNP
jgi:Ycf66 protein N-terminus